MFMEAFLQRQKLESDLYSSMVIFINPKKHVLYNMYLRTIKINGLDIDENIKYKDITILHKFSILKFQ